VERAGKNASVKLRPLLRVDLRRADAEFITYPPHAKVLALKGKLMPPERMTDALKGIEAWMRQNTPLTRPTVHRTEAELGRIIKEAKQRAAALQR
jgi:hypothetical protein